MGKDKSNTPQERAGTAFLSDKRRHDRRPRYMIIDERSGLVA
jgi:hypothetical protein